MPRFSDQWVVDRTLFEFATGGSCACCGFSHLFLPNGLKGLIDEVSDLETDAANNEFEAAQKSPWPPTMRDQVWADRVRLRHERERSRVDGSRRVGPAAVAVALRTEIPVPGAGADRRRPS